MLARFDPEVESGMAPSFGAFWPVMEGYEHSTLVEWAVKVRNCPVVPARMEEQLGLVLVGGGMDLSYGIAEAFIRIGFNPAASLAPLPLEPHNFHERAIALALWRSVRSLSMGVAHHQYQLETMLGITAQEEKALLP